MFGNPIIAQTAVEFGQDGKPKHNIFSFRVQFWQDHFKNLKKGAILVDTKTRSLHYWSKNGSEYKVFPTSVPLNKELTRLGYTKVTKKDQEQPNALEQYNIILKLYKGLFDNIEDLYSMEH